MNKVYFYLAFLLALTACNDKSNLTKRAYELSSNSEKRILDRLPVIHQYDSILTYKSTIESNKNILNSKADYLNSICSDSLLEIENIYTTELNSKINELNESYTMEFNTIKEKANNKLNEFDFRISASLFRDGSTDCDDKGNFTVSIFGDYSSLYQQTFYAKDRYSKIEIPNLYRMIDIERVLNIVFGESE